MDIFEIKKLKLECQNKISGAISSLLGKFEDQTGVSPDSIRIEMVNVTCKEALPEKKYIVGRTVMHLEI